MKWSNVSEDNLKNAEEIPTEFGQTLYWDYYSYVKENPIENWDKKTCILYGNKDNLQDEKLINDFCNRFNCDLVVLENGEHFFHTKEQLEFYTNWLNEKV